MNRLLIVTLLKKNIEELNMLTDGFREMTEYPAVILSLARKKTDEIKEYIDQLGEKHPELEEELSPTLPPVIMTEKENVEIEVPQSAIIQEEVLPVEQETLTETDEILEMEVISETDEITEGDEIPAVEEMEVIPIFIEPVPEIEPEPDVIAVIEETIETPSAVEPIEEARKSTTLGDKMHQNGPSRNEMHARPEQSGIHSSIANKKVDDIRQAISLGDRFRFQRELFRNNGEDMNKTLSYINMLATYNEVISFLLSKYGWQEDNEAVQDFFQIIKRKF